MNASRTGKRRNRRPRSRTVLTVALAVFASACAGPFEPLEVGVANVASDIVLGPVEVVRAEAPPAPVPPNAMPIRRQTVISVPAPQPEPPVFPEAPPPPDLGPCPPASPIASPAIVAPNDITMAPAPAVYTYRNDGRFERSGANAMKGSFPPESRREVQAVADNGDGSFTFAVRATLEQTVTTTTYRVQPAATAEPGPTGVAVGGLYIQRIVTQEYAEGVDPNDPEAEPAQESSFEPTSEMQLAALPLVTGQEVNTTGVDPDSGQALAMQTTVMVKDRVDACGEVIDIHVLRVDGEFGQCPGTVEPPDSPAGPLPAEPPAVAVPCVADDGVNLDLDDVTREAFTAEYRIATQFGGLIVEDRVEILSEGPGGNVYRTNTATINRMPAAPIVPPPATEGQG